jgi:hypothetical protein
MFAASNPIHGLHWHRAGFLKRYAPLLRASPPRRLQSQTIISISLRQGIDSVSPLSISQTYQFRRAAPNSLSVKRQQHANSSRRIDDV